MHDGKHEIIMAEALREGWLKTVADIAKDHEIVFYAIAKVDGVFVEVGNERILRMEKPGDPTVDKLRRRVAELAGVKRTHKYRKSQCPDYWRETGVPFRSPYKSVNGKTMSKKDLLTVVEAAKKFYKSLADEDEVLDSAEAGAEEADENNQPLADEDEVLDSAEAGAEEADENNQPLADEDEVLDSAEADAEEADENNQPDRRTEEEAVDMVHVTERKRRATCTISTVAEACSGEEADENNQPTSEEEQRQEEPPAAVDMAHVTERRRRRAPCTTAAAAGTRQKPVKQPKALSKPPWKPY